MPLGMPRCSNHPLRGNGNAPCCRLVLHADVAAHEQGALRQAQLHDRRVADGGVVVVDAVEQPLSVAVKVDVVRESPYPRRGRVLVQVAHVFVDSDDGLLEPTTKRMVAMGSPCLTPSHTQHTKPWAEWNSHVGLP